MTQLRPGDSPWSHWTPALRAVEVSPEPEFWLEAWSPRGDIGDGMKEAPVSMTGCRSLTASQRPFFPLGCGPWEVSKWALGAPRVL